MSQDKSASRRLLANGAWITLGIALGRATGLARDAYIAGTFGVTERADAATLTLALPEILLNILVGGTIGYVLIPEFSRLGRKEGFQAYLQASLVSTLFFGAFAAALSLASGSVIRLMAPGFGAEAAAQTAAMFRWAVWAVPMIALAGVSTAYLHTRDHFAIPAMENVLTNVAFIGVMALLLNRLGLMSVPAGVLAGAGVRFASQALYTLCAHGEGWIRWSWRLDRALLTRYFQAIGAGALGSFLPIISRQLASFGGSGSVAMLTYALKLAEMPLALSVSVIAKAVFPRLSQHFADAQGRERGQAMAQETVQITLIVSFALALSLIWLARGISGLDLSFHGLSAHDVSEILRLSMIGLLALPATGIVAVTTVLFNANRHTAWPFYLMMGSTALFGVLGWVLMKSNGVGGILLAYVWVQYLTAGAQGWFLRTKLGIDCIGKANVRTTIIAILMCGAGFMPGALLTVLAQPRQLISHLALSALTGAISLGCGLLAVGRWRAAALRWISRAPA